jgi:hypothetical protein
LIPIEWMPGISERTARYAGRQGEVELRGVRLRRERAPCVGGQHRDGARMTDGELLDWPPT